jgi:glycosyltransferase involved in cell wall biosynthesis
MAFEIACCLALGDSLAWNYLRPIARHPLVSRVWIVRSAPIRYGELPKAEYVLTPGPSRLRRFWQMRNACLHLARRAELRAFVSFNPIPYGLISCLAARRYGRKIHFGFIGSDWNLRARSLWGGPLLPVLRRGDFITVTGAGMKEQVLQNGFDPARVAVLPNCVDTDRFPVGEPAKAKYDCVFVGRLIPLKQVDVILRAWAAVAARRPQARLCVVGDGPLRGELEALAARLGIAGSVDFTGAVPDAAPYLAAARTVVIASTHEGLPFAILEGVCCGLVPVSTPVGAIPELLSDGQNALLVPVGDPQALSVAIRRLMEEPGLYDRLRSSALALRGRVSHDAATAVWDPWLRSLDRGD